MMAAAMPHFNIFYAAPGHGRAELANPSPDSIAPMVKDLRAALTREPDSFSMRVHSRAKPDLNLVLLWHLCGRSAGTAHWVNDRVIEASSMLLSGVNDAHD